MRFTVKSKVSFGLAAVAFIGIAAMAIIYAGLNTLERAVHALASEEGPFNSAAYEMEVNVNGIGFAVLNYLATANPQYRSWVSEDHIDFGNYHTTYMGLTRTAREKELGERVGVLYAEFKAMGDGLMQKRDQQEVRFGEVSTNIEEIDRIIDQQIQPAIEPLGSTSAGSFEKAIVVANLEADIAEVGFRVANYQRIAKPQSKALIFEKLQEFRNGLDRFKSLNLGSQEKRWSRTLDDVFQQTAEAIGEVVVLEDFIVGNRQRFVDLRVAMDRLLDNEIQPLALAALELPRQRADQAAQRVQQTMLYLIPAFVLSAGFVGALFVRSIMRPLDRLRSGTEAISHGNLAYRIPPAGSDEFSDLAERFNQMVEQLESTTVSKDRLLESETKLQQSVTDLRHQIAERERAEDQQAMLAFDLRRSRRCRPWAP